MRTVGRAQTRTFGSVVLCSSLGVTLGCAERIQSADAEIRAGDAAAAAAAAASCATGPARGRNLSFAKAVKPFEYTIAVGDTGRLADVLSEHNAAVPSTPWSIENADLARINADLVIPLAAGRTRVIGQIAGRMVCVGLTTMFTGASLNSMSLDGPASDVRDATQLNATLHYSNGMSLRVQEAAQWTSLDPAVAVVSRDAWITPVRSGAARVVARVGPFADTVLFRVELQPFESIVPRRAEDFVSSIGVNVHLSYFDRVYGSGFRSIIVPRLQELNLRHLRDGGTTLPNEDWMREVYGRWRELAEATQAKFTIIMSPRRTETGPGTNYGDMSHVHELRDRIGQDHIAAFEGLNEHDLSGRSNFAQEVRISQQALYTAVKSDPSLASRFAVLGPSLAFVTASPQVGDLSAYMDAGAIHPYDGGQVPSTNLRSHVDGIRVISGSDALEATEVGYHTASTSSNPWHWSLTEQAQAKYTLRQFLELFNAGIRRSFAYELIDEGTDPSDMELNFGLLRNDGSAKPAFTALRNLVALLGDRNAPSFTPAAMRMNLIGDTAGVHRLVVEKANGRQYVILWQNTLSFDKVLRTDISAGLRPVTVQLPSSASTINIFSPLTGQSPMATHHSTRTVAVAVADHPIVIEVVK